MNTLQYVTCRCQHCEGGIEFNANDLADENNVVPCPHCGLETKLWVPVSSPLPRPHFPHVRLPEIQIPLAVDPPPRPPTSMMVVKRRLYLQMTKLTELSLKKRTTMRLTPLHRAAEKGVIPAIPSHLLTLELFMEKNTCGETPLHIAARCGYLHQVPSIFMTFETLRVFNDSGEMPLHVAARCRQLCLVPRRLLTAEILILRTQDLSASTVLHFIALANRLDLISDLCITPEMWALKSGDGSTPRDCLDRALLLLSQKNNDRPWRREPASEKQENKLRFFGCTWDEGITKGQASDAIDECVAGFPHIDEAYYTRPATEEQREKLRSYGKDPDKRWGKPRRKAITYEEAKDWLQECYLLRRAKTEKEFSDECDRALLRRVW